MDDDKVLLKIDTSRFYVDMAEALVIAKALGSALRIKEMRTGADDWGDMVVEPDIGSAVILPMTGHYWLELETNRKANEARGKK
jgi:hypothetical protein